MKIEIDPSLYDALPATGTYEAEWEGYELRVTVPPRVYTPGLITGRTVNGVRGLVRGWVTRGESLPDGQEGYVNWEERQPSIEELAPLF